jgi:hypothetical protein
MTQYPDTQVARLLEETMQAVGAKQGQKQPSKSLDTRTIGALAITAVLSAIVIVAAVNQVPASTAVLPTAAIPTIPQPTLEPTPFPAPDEPVSQDAPVVVAPPPVPVDPVAQPVFPTEEPAPVIDTQSTADKQATVEAWVQAPPSTSTSLPEPGEPGFRQSFQDPPECNPFIGYVGPKRTYCQAIYATQTAEADEH